MADFSLITNHPNCEEIISKLVSGTVPKEVSRWLKLKYPNKDQKHLNLTIKLLKDFVNSQYLDTYNQFTNDLVDTKNDNKINKKVSDSLLNNKTYKERLNQIADKELDIREMLVSTITLIRDRAEQVFDKIQEDPEDFKGDAILIKWFDQLFNAVDKYDKIINQSPDQIIQHNVTIQAVEEHTAIFQDVIREILTHFDPEISFLFVELLTERLGKLKAPKEEVLSMDKRLAEATKLSEKITNID